MSEPAVANSRVSGLPPQVLETLKWLATTLGVTGTLLVCGFISEFSYQDRLGYSFSSEDPAGYCSEAGRFLLSLLVIVLTWTAEHVGWLAFTLIGLTGAGFAWRRLPASVPRNSLRLALLAVLLAAVLVVFDLPTVDLRGALILPVTRPRAASAGWPLGSLTQRVWEDEICSRITYSPSNDTQLLQFRQLAGNCKYPADVHKRHKQDRFALNALSTFALTLLSTLALLSSKELRLGYALPALVFLLSVLDVLLLPYAYAKTVRPTEADDVKVTWVDKAAEEKLAGEAEFFLLYKTKDEVALLERNEGRVWVIPGAQVRLLQIVGHEDALAFVIGKKLEGVASKEAP